VSVVVKVCGITNQEDACAAMAGGATAIGFNFYPRSPRYLAPESAAVIASHAGVQRVGVFVNESAARVQEIACLARLNIAQLQGDEGAANYPAGIAVWKAVRVSNGLDLGVFDELPVEALVLDGPAGELYGGAGKSFDWRQAVSLRKRFVLAGGLDASNVAEAIALAHPWGVDACSLLESVPGRKDHKKMLAFLAAAKAAFEL
jgi:phosphoribosylanthranilate isomerase